MEHTKNGYRPAGGELGGQAGANGQGRSAGGGQDRGAGGGQDRGAGGPRSPHGAAYIRADGRPLTVFALGEWDVFRAGRRGGAAAIAGADVYLSRGAGLLPGSGGRARGIRLAEGLMAAPSVVPFRVFLLGGAPGEAGRAARALEARFPGVALAGDCPPGMRGAALAAVRAARPHLFLLSLPLSAAARLLSAAPPPCLTVAVPGCFAHWGRQARRRP